jgi:GT2 family glycosyltransferase
MSGVDVVVPCYGYARYLEGCVTSVLTQRDVDVRVLILDDCSPDHTPSVAAMLAAADERVTYVRNEKNLGLIATANRGVMDWASSEYVVLLSADDLLAPGALARATRLMDAHPEVAMAYGMALILFDDGPELEADDGGDAPVRVVAGERFLRRVFEEGNAVPTPCAVMRTRVQHRIGPYDPEFRHTSDLDTWMRAALAGSIGVVGAVQGFYRWHAANMSAAYQRRPLSDRREVILTCRAFERRFGRDRPQLGAWLQAMERRFGEEALWIAGQSFVDPEDQTWKETLAFAKQHNPGIRRSKAYWKFMAKRALGRRAGALLSRRAAGPKDGVEHGMRIGWWPPDEDAPPKPPVHGAAAELTPIGRT